MNSMEFNKIAGATIGALLIFLLLNFFSGLIYGTREAAHAVDDEHGPVLAYAVAVEAEGTAAPAEEEQVDLLALFQAAGPADGERQFRACSACHAVEPGVNKVGPTMHDVVGRQVAAVDGFAYSDAMAAHGGVWTPEELFDFLQNPKAHIPGTKMSYAGMPDPAARADVIAYMNQLGDTPVDLTEGIEPLAPVDAGAAEVAEGREVAATGTEGEGAMQADGTEGAITGEPVQGTVPGAEQGDVDVGGTPPPVTPESATETTTSSLVGVEEPTVVEREAVDVGSEDVEVQSTTPLQIGEATPPDTVERAIAQEPEILREQEAQTEEPAEPAGEAAPDQVAAAPDQATAGAFPAGDAAAGERVFRRCQACHKLEEGRNAIGPSLHDIVGREIATVEGFNYSDAMAAHDGVWTPEALSQFLENPKAVIPGTKMAFAGLRDEQDRIDVITYLRQAAQ